MIAPFFKHQQETINFLKNVPQAFVASDPGTGKTRAVLAEFWQRRQAGEGPALVFAPKSILQPAWGNDIDKWFPGMTYSVAYAHNRKKAFALDVDVYITNHDAVKWVHKHSGEVDLARFSTLIVDESTAYKNQNSQRSRAIRLLTARDLFPHRVCMSGTPNPNSVTELWHQALILDRGERLGNSYWRFRHAVCEPVQVGPGQQHVKWVDKPGAETVVADMLDDITIRHAFEDCIDIPPNRITEVRFDLPQRARDQYEEMRQHALIELGKDDYVAAIHASSLTNKLLQVASGAVYRGGGEYVVLDDTRTDIIMDLLDPRPHSLVAFNWQHQRDQLTRAAKRRSYQYAFIDGTVPQHERTQIVNAFQAGELKVLFIQPASAGHGLTLTKGTTTIWASPTYNSEHYKQVNHRIYRSGQTERTETIHVIANSTIDISVYDKLNGKLDRMQNFLEMALAA